MLITEVLQVSLMLLFFVLVLGVSYWFVLPARSERLYGAPARWRVHGREEGR